MAMLDGRKVTARILIMTAALIIIALLCSMLGTEDISLSQVWKGLSQDESATALNADYEIFFHIRLPRIILAGIVGAALACSGVVFQALLRNPLAEPYILGISSGAGLGAMLAIIAGLDIVFLGRSAVAPFAFVGAIGTVALVWAVGRYACRASMTGLLLAGVVVNAFFSSLIMFITSIAESDKVFSTIFWLMGNISEQAAIGLWLLSGLVLTGIVGLFYLAPGLNAICFGEAEAKSVGVNVTAVQWTAFGISALITAAAVSVSGLIGFVGLIVPHAVRLVFGPDHRQLIPLSALSGAAFLIAADTLARVIVAPAQLPVGVVTALIGGPFFLILLIRQTRRRGGYK
ncbi:Hemin transport system permease protein HmuU [Anaerohalosphaera lusitana]|uniref:Hemin transport system permease protein HmuU n=1 Tax=Anaerohalosphaera lusitana TaxID=1936003 RepID=A0A1U9NPG0_9BACT|nr:iron ABC transporter permease [Anaerohalosphaera lusitana]AQT69725.1 Hemin transport system permease protein HmuU [Anaerohalosphaera lusitana]